MALSLKNFRNLPEENLSDRSGSSQPYLQVPHQKKGSGTSKVDRSKLLDTFDQFMLSNQKEAPKIQVDDLSETPTSRQVAKRRSTDKKNKANAYKEMYQDTERATKELA